MLKLTETFLSAKPSPWSYSISGLVFICAVVISLLFWTHSVDLSLSRAQLESTQEYWRLFTTSFVHGDLKHLLSNALFLWIFGFLLNSYFGFWVFPVLSFAMGGLINFLTLQSYSDQVVLLGASGVVYWMAAFWATQYVMIERGVHPLKRVMAVIGVCLILLFPTSYEPHVSYSAHAWGFILGIAAGLIYFRLRRSKIRTHERWVETQTGYGDQNDESAEVQAASPTDHKNSA